MKLSTIGLDIAKSVFQVHGADEHGHMMVRKQLRRAQVLTWFAQTPACRIGIEACGGAHYWARELIGLGHDVKLIAPQHVKPFVRGNKNDRSDAQAICRAVREPDMPFVPVAQARHQDLQALHRVRSRLMSNRTRLCNQTRGLLLEYGVAWPKGVAQLRAGLAARLRQETDTLSETLRELLQEQYSELLDMDRKIDQYTRLIETQVKNDPAGVNLMQVLGIGKLSASALLMKAHEGNSYRNGRHFAAALGLVPKHEGTGGKVQLGRISKRGDRYLRSLLIHGARAVAAQIKDKDDALSRWLRRLIAERGMNKAVVALANKNARIAWAMMSSGEVYRSPRATPGI